MKVEEAATRLQKDLGSLVGIVGVGFDDACLVVYTNRKAHMKGSEIPRDYCGIAVKVRWVKGGARLASGM